MRTVEDEESFVEDIEASPEEVIVDNLDGAVED